MTKHSLYVAQLDEADCGAAALGMILRYYNSNVSLAIIRNFAQTDKNGTSALGLVKAAEHFNLTTKAIQADMSLFDNELPNAMLPFIAHVNTADDFLHYLVVLKATKDYILIADPDPDVRFKKMSYREFEYIWSGVALFMTPDNDYVPQKINSDSLWKTGRVLLKYKGIILVIIILTLISTLITIFGTMFLQKIIDDIVPKKDLNMLTTISLGLLAAYIFNGISSFVVGLFSTILGQHLSKDILLKYIQHLLKLPISFFEKRKTGELTSRFSDASNIINTLAKTAIVTILNIGTILVIGVFLLNIDVRLFGMALLSIPIYLVIILAFVRHFDKWNNKVMEQNADLSSQIIESLTGINTVKSLNAEDKMYGSIRTKFNNMLHSSFMYGLLSILQESIKSVTNLLIDLGILFWGSILTIKGVITVGQLISFNALMAYFLDPIEEIINLQDEIQTAKVANIRINQVLSSPVEDTVNVPVFKGNAMNNIIDIHNVNFEYKYGRPVLRNINLKMNTGESLTIVGLSGSGKSTLAKLLVGFYYPNDGEVLVSGVNTRQQNSRALRSFINYVPQTPYIFSGTVAENIMFGNRAEKSHDMMIEAAKLAEIHDVICELPNGYDTKLSEDSGLSGGQLQRISIARALASQTSVLIFDESTSSLDLLTEKKVLDNIMTMKDKTIIFIAHRLEIAKKTTKIAVMKNGEIVESGTHDELLSNKKYYAQLWEQ